MVANTIGGLVERIMAAIEVLKGPRFEPLIGDHIHIFGHIGAAADTNGEITICLPPDAAGRLRDLGGKMLRVYGPPDCRQADFGIMVGDVQIYAHILPKDADALGVAWPTAEVA